MRLSSAEKGSANALPAVLRNNRQIVDVEERARLERREPEEADGDPHGACLGEGQQYQRSRMIPQCRNKPVSDLLGERLSATEGIRGVGVQHLDDCGTVSWIRKICLVDRELHFRTEPMR